jgi:hypothetical protein
MKQNRLFFVTIATTILFLFLIGCDQGENPVQSFRDVVDKIPNLQPIEGAQNVSKTVKTNFDDSYFTIEIRNVAPGAAIQDGVYNGWCLQMEVPISTDIETHGHQIFSTQNDGKYNYINYLLNKRSSYNESYANLTWREVQVAIWTILETSDFNLGRIESRIPSSVDGYNTDLVNVILGDVQKNGWRYKPQVGHIKLNYINNENEQDTGYEQCETAWSEGPRYTEQGNWAMYTPYVPDTTVDLIAGQNMVAGTVHFSAAVGGQVTITIELDPGWSFGNVAENVKIQDYDVAPDGNPNPGGFDHKFTAAGSSFSEEVPENDFYGVHVDVCLTLVQPV